MIKILGRIFGINLYMHAVRAPKKDVKAFFHFFCQLIVMFLSLVIGYISTYLVEYILTEYIPVNDTTIVLSVIILIGLFILIFALTFIVGYYYNKFAINQIKKYS